MLKDQRRAYQFALLTVLLWSTVATAFKLALQTASPLQVVVVSSFTSLLVLCFLYQTEKQNVTLYQRFQQLPLKYIVSGNINPVIYYLVLFAAYDKLPAQVALSINYTWAVVLSLLAAPVLGQRFTKADGVGLALCYLGIVILVTRFDFSQFAAFDLQGIALAVLSTFIWAIYWLVNTKSAAPPITSILLGFICATPALSILAWINWDSFHFNTVNLSASIYIGLCEMSLAFVFWLKAMKYAQSTAKISGLVYLSPILSLCLVYIVLDEPIFSTTVLGLAVILSGLFLQKRLGKKVKHEQA